VLNPAAIGVGLEQGLDLFKDLPVEDRLLFALEPFTAVVNLANISTVLQEIGEGAVGEGNTAIVFGDLGVPALGDDATPVQFGNKFAERFQLKVKAEDGADGLGLGLVNDQLLVPGLVAEWDRAASPFSGLLDHQHVCHDQPKD
jgi:hypothetical protein